MSAKTFHDGRATLHAGDCLNILKMLESDSIDAVVTDPPYHLTSIVKRFGSKTAAAAKDYSGQNANATGAYARASKGFMGKEWDGGDIAFRAELWAEVLRVLKPSGHLVAFSGTRTYHRMAVAIEDAGFEVRDMLSWLYGTGFPKSHDVSKSVDRVLGAERAKVRIDASEVRNPNAPGGGLDGAEGGTRPWIEAAIERGFHERDSDEPATDEAREWSGWGTALKPACEPICFARKPLSEKSVAANVLRWGTGAINVDACRVGFASDDDKAAAAAASQRACRDQNANRVAYGQFTNGASSIEGYLAGIDGGRWPANVLIDDSADVAEAFGEAARFFYSAKANATDRVGSKHPTVKPVDLMRWLVRLVCPRGGVVLDPFAGTGTTGAAALAEGNRAVLIEREAEYRADIARRMDLLFAGDLEKAVLMNADAKHADLPLFGGEQ